MPQRSKVLHIASHLGGGVGRALSSQCLYNFEQANEIEDSFICLETPRDARYADLIKASGARILIAPDNAQIRYEIAAADIVQLEWWHHPLMAGKLELMGSIPARWVVWAHSSGLHYPFISKAFADLPHAFVATTPATLPLLGEGANNLVSYVSSTGGFDDFPSPADKRDEQVRCGYLGALSPAKLHPDIMNYMKAIDRAVFKADFYGDSAVNPTLEAAIKNLGEKSPIRLKGFCNRPQDVLPQLDVFIYLLNPTHYGSTENALLEAMACGAVPIVLDNPVESAIVQHNVTGLVVSNPQNFADAVNFLLDHPQELRLMRLACSEAVRREYSVAHSAAQFADIYRKVMKEDKKKANFGAVFGARPTDMFLSCLGQYVDCFPLNTQGDTQRSKRLGLPFLYDKSKSSIFQFCYYFPDDVQLAAWQAMLYKDKASFPHLSEPSL